MHLYTETLGQGKTIILVHGWAMHSGVWEGFAGELAKQYRVILIDLPGHGRSEKITEFTLGRLRQILVEVVPKQPCCWVGWSLGTKIILDIYQYYPELFSSLVLMAGNPHFTRNEHWPGVNDEFLQDFKLSLEKNGEVALQRFLLLQLKGTNEAKLLARHLKKIISQYCIPDNETLVAGLDILQQADLRPALASVQCPVSIILGGKDSLVPVSAGHAMQELQPNCQLQVVKQAGHLPFLSHQSQVTEILQKFVG